MRLPSDRAHAWQIMRMCHAFSQNDLMVTLFVPNRKSDSDEDPFTYYNLPQSFTITKIPVLDLFPVSWMPRKIAYWVNTFTFNLGLLLKLGYLKKGSVYSRDPVSAFILGRFNPSFCYEVHDSPKKTWLNKVMLNGVNKLAVTNTWKKQKLMDDFGCDEHKMLIIHHGVDVEKYAHLPEKNEAHNKTGLSKGKRYIIYTGHLFEWKGVYALARSSRFLDEDTEIVLVGGTKGDVEKMQQFLDREQLTRVRLTGFKQRSDMLHYAACADVMVIPTSGQFNIGKYESSPLKLFEYMAAGKPIVATDLPAIRDIVDESMVYFCEPDKPSHLSQMIKEALKDMETTKIQNALRFVKKNTWEARAKKIIDWI